MSEHIEETVAMCSKRLSSISGREPGECRQLHQWMT